MAVRLFGEFLAAHGMPTEVEGIAREHVESFMTDVLAMHKPSTG